MGLIFGLLSLIGATLTLPGIAGIVLTIGMAVDANVLIFERIREEMKTAKGAARAIELGYEKAMSAIVDANITTFITAVILYAMGSGPVRGFAITLGLGIITSVFTALFVTRLIVVIWFERKRPKAVLQGRTLRLVPQQTAIDFFSRWKIWLGISGVMIVVALGSFAVQGLNFGIDFKGGTTIRTQSAEPVDVAQYRGAIDGLGLGDVNITEVFDPTFGPDENVAMIRIQAQDDTESVSPETSRRSRRPCKRRCRISALPRSRASDPRSPASSYRRRSSPWRSPWRRCCSTSGCGSNGSSRSGRCWRWCMTWR